MKFYYPDNQFLVYRNRKIKNKLPNGEVEETIRVEYYPVELLKPTGLTDYQRNNNKLMRDLGKITITKAAEKFNDISKGLNLLTKNLHKEKLKFNIDIENNQIVGYQLPAPTMIHAKKEE